MISLIQTAKGNGGGYVNSVNVALGSNASAGNALLMGIVTHYPVSPTITDSRGNSWNLAVEIASSERKAALYYAKNILAGATTVNLAFSGFYDTAVILREYSGLDLVSPLDVSASGQSGLNYVNSQTTSPTGTPTSNNQLVIAVAGVNHNNPIFAAGSGYGNLTSQAGFDLYSSVAMEDKIIATAAAQTGVFSTTEYVVSATVVATFKEAVAAAAGQPTAKRIATVPFLGGSLRQSNF
jgi:hypothetical protein